MRPAFRALSIVLVVVALVAGLTGCSRDVAVTVNGDKISKSAIDAQLKQIEAVYPQLFQGKDAQARRDDYSKRLLDQAITQVLLAQEAKRLNIDISDDAVNKAIETVKKGFPSEAAFTDALKKNGITLDKLKEQMRAQLVTQNLMNRLAKDVKIPDKALLDYYNKNKTAFQEKVNVHVEQILFDAKDKATADLVLQQIKNGSNFATLAKKYSKDTASAAKGGDLGWSASREPFLPEFQKAVQSLSPGQLDKQLVKTSSGYHIIKVLERRPARMKTFAEVKDQIRQLLVQNTQSENYQKLVDQLKKKAKIEYPQS